MTTTVTGTRSAEPEGRSGGLHSDKKVTPVGGAGTHLNALRTALEHRQAGSAAS
jgi:hypothetical protein